MSSERAVQLCKNDYSPVFPFKVSLIRVLPLARPYFWIRTRRLFVRVRHVAIALFCPPWPRLVHVSFGHGRLDINQLRSWSLADCLMCTATLLVPAPSTFGVSALQIFADLCRLHELFKNCSCAMLRLSGIEEALLLFYYGWSETRLMLLILWQTTAFLGSNVQVSSGIPGGLYLPIVPRGDETSASRPRRERFQVFFLCDVGSMTVYSCILYTVHVSKY